VEIPYDQVIQSGTLSIASAANHRIWLNGVFLGEPLYPGEWHLEEYPLTGGRKLKKIKIKIAHDSLTRERYWNAVITVAGGLFTSSSNTLAVEVI
jgi:hypothetical protein